MSAKAYGSMYDKAQKNNLSSREIPARGLLEAARRLDEALHDIENRDKMDQALDFQWQLWSLFQTEALSDDFSFGEEGRILFIKICYYIDRAILDFFGNREDNLSHISTFININRVIAQGFLVNKEDPSQNSQRQDSLNTESETPKISINF